MIILYAIRHRYFLVSSPILVTNNERISSSYSKAFSHFTFEASCHEQIVVDIQGVGDLYTDPQIHTSLGFEYGGE